jgi:phosphate uptake regulator
MSSITVRLPESLHRKVREIAKADGVSLNQFISSAVGEKLSSVLTLAYLEKRAERADSEAFDRILQKVPGRQPLEHDQL